MSENSSPESSGAGAEGAPASPAAEGGAPDFQSMLAAMQQESGARYQELDSRYNATSKELGSTKETLDRLRAALSPETGGGKGDPGGFESKISAAEAQLDQYLAAAVEAERQKRPIPLTTNLAVQFFQQQIEMLKEKQTHQTELADMKRQLAALSNPERQIDVTAYSNIDTQVHTALQQVYGDNDDYAAQRTHQFDAITKQIGSEIKELKKDDPDLWDRIRRDPKSQAKLVRHFVEKNIPPRARQILEEDHVKKTPMTTNELMEAFREAKEKIKDPREREQITSRIRQELLARKFSGEAPPSAAPMRQLF